jgi:ribosomal RNA assembly protein
MNKERIAVLIGKNGKTKQLIEKLTHTKIEINSDTGEYLISPDESSDSNNHISLDDIDEIQLELDISVKEIKIDSNFGAWISKTVLDAINNGFKPEKALKLLDQRYSIDILNLEDILGSSDKRIHRVKSRIIGEQGRMRESIERFSLTNISVYNNSIGIIGEFDAVKVAKKAISMIIDGLPLKTVNNFLQKKFQENKDHEFQENWKPTFD